MRGKAAVTYWFKEELAKTHVGKEGDIVIYPIISVDGDQATGSWLLYMMYFYPRTGQSLFWVQGSSTTWSTLAKTAAGRSR